MKKYYDGLAILNEKILAEMHKLDSLVRSDASQRQVYIKLLSSGEELRDYLSGIKQFSSLTWGEEELVRQQRFAVRQMIDRVVRQFESKCEDLGIKIEISCQDGLEVYSQETILEHILFNLVSNAVKYTPQGGRVDIMVRVLPGGETVFSVTDNGIGIPLEHQKLIFEKFYRVTDSDHGDVKGHGLGLYLCQFFAKKIGGKIEVLSESGQGSTFLISVKPQRWAS